MGPLRTNDNPSASNGDFGPSQLAGMTPGPDPSEMPGGSPEAQSNALQSTVEQVRGIEQAITTLAQQFPAAAPEVRRAVDAIRAVLQRIVSSPTQPEPDAPNSMA